MNNFYHKLIITLALILPLIANTVNAAGRSGGSSTGFKGGFSSQRNVSKPAPSKSSSTSFGSFNTSKPASSRNSDSVMNRDLQKNQAQANALKSMDARKQATMPASPPPLNAGNSTGNNAGSNNNNSFGSNGGNAGNNATNNGFAYGNAGNMNRPVTPVPTAPVIVSSPAPAPIIVQRSGMGGGMAGAFMGFMLGSMISHPAAAESAGPRSGQLEPIAGQSSTVGDNASASLPTLNTQSAQIAQRASAVQEEGSGWKLLRLAAWSLILGGLGWLTYKIWRVVKPVRKQASTANYSLGGN
ncbi:hypothetical protein ACO0LM_17725 [Undibacterium sp. Di26W]|uniref:hypothetical protein n=1 Tax=Undibacterium sp. Di26W TaxID=3413035 RepID=UPI003BF2CC03